MSLEQVLERIAVALENQTALLTVHLSKAADPLAEKAPRGRKPKEEKPLENPSSSAAPAETKPPTPPVAGSAEQAPKDERFGVCVKCGATIGKNKAPEKCVCGVPAADAFTFATSEAKANEVSANVKARLAAEKPKESEGKGPTQEEIRAALVDLQRAKGAEVVRKIVAEIGNAQIISKIEPSKYAAVLKAVEEAKNG